MIALADQLDAAGAEGLEAVAGPDGQDILYPGFLPVGPDAPGRPGVRRTAEEHGWTFESTLPTATSGTRNGCLEIEGAETSSLRGMVAWRLTARGMNLVAPVARRL